MSLEGDREDMIQSVSWEEWGAGTLLCVELAKESKYVMSDDVPPFASSIKAKKWRSIPTKRSWEKKLEQTQLRMLLNYTSYIVSYFYDRKLCRNYWIIAVKG